MKRVQNQQPYSVLRYVIGLIVLVCLSITLMSYSRAASSARRFGLVSGKKLLNVISWNMAAINNNPFEYWITYKEDPSYDTLMVAVSKFIETPGARDIPVHQVFTQAMFDELCNSLRQHNIDGVNETILRWNEEYKNRKIISEFMKDGTLGKKRLTSMPDRITNTIPTATSIAYRPTVINCYGATSNFSSLQDWWVKWKLFMFTEPLTLMKNNETSETRVITMLSKIKHSKYPSISEDEEAISIPLQTLCLAIFDAILIHMMDTLSPVWQTLRTNICVNLNLHKNARSMEILRDSYHHEDMCFLQEVSSSFIHTARSSVLASSYDIHTPASIDSDRDQNSIILLMKFKYKDVVEVTDEVLKEFPVDAKVPIAEGDLFVLLATNALDGTKYLLASFHGDTNGLATVPVVTAVHQYAVTKQREAKLLFGMDANTYERPEADQQGVMAFAETYRALQLTSCYGDTPDPSKYTTFAARTHLQPQLNKAVAFDEKDVKGDKNPKDFVLFFKADFETASVIRDNTGVRKFVDNMVIPTLQFPSDHAITSAVLVEDTAE